MPAAAVERVAPAVVMMDVDHARRVDLALARAAQRAGAPIVLFTASRSLAELQRAAEAQSAGFFLLPNGPRALAAAIGDALIALRRDGVDDEIARIAWSVRLAAHHRERVRWHATIVKRLLGEVGAAERREAGAAPREALRCAMDASREAEAQLRADIAQYVRRLKALEVGKRELVAQLGGIVQEALNGSRPTADEAALEWRVGQWCTEAYDSAA